MEDEADTGASRANAPNRRHALEASRQIHWDRITAHQGGRDALDALVAQLLAYETRSRARKTDASMRLKATMEAFALDLFVSAKAAPAQFLAYSRDRNAYAPSRYSNPNVTHTAVGDVADFLLSSGNAEGAPGYRFRTASGAIIGRRSRIRATAALVELFEAHGLSLQDVTHDPATETIRLKARDADQRKPLLGYEDTAATTAIRASLSRINALLASTSIDLDESALGGLEESEPEDDEEESSRVVDQSAVRLHRTFNNGRFDHGGRFYGGWWMSLPRRHRPALLPDGETTIELDYSALHARLCYLLSGLDWPADADPHTLPAETAVPRRLAKDAFNRLLNASTGATPKAPKGISASDWRRALAAVRDHHAPVAGWFGSGRGMELQWIDSAIAESVLVGLGHIGVPCLPIHDSFVVPASKEFLLGQTMYMAFRGQLERFNGVKAWPAVSGWSSTDIEARVAAWAEESPRVYGGSGFVGDGG